MFKCKICGKSFVDLTGLYTHIDKYHKSMIPKDMSVPQYYYYMKTGRTNGNCVMCKQPTTWNKNTNKYNRFCDNPACKEKYVAEFRKRMITKYGKVHLLNDPAKQREMLANRKISGTYRWDNGSETAYTGSYELDFLKLLDNFFDWDPVDISMPSPHTYSYIHEGVERFYIPDVFIHSLDLEIEVKDGGDNPNMHHKIQDVDKVKEKLKDEVLMSQKAFHYIKITNKNYTNFFNFLKKAKEEFSKYEDEKKIPRIFMVEDIKTKSAPKSAKTLYESIEVEENAENVTIFEHEENRIVNHEFKNKVLEVATSLEVNELVTESFISNLEKTIKSLDKLSVIDCKKLVEINMDSMKDDLESIKKYTLKLIKSSKSEQDLLLIRQLTRKYMQYTESIAKADSSKVDVEREYKLWVVGEYGKEYDKKWKKVTESIDYIEFERNDYLEEGKSLKNIALSTVAISLISKQINKIANMSDADIDKVQIKKVKKEDIKSVRDLLKAVNTLLKAVKTIKAIKAVIRVIKYCPILYQCFIHRNDSFEDFSDAVLKSAGKRVGIKPDQMDSIFKTADNIIEVDEYEIIEEGLNLDIDKALVWLDKPLAKLRNKDVTLYHGSIDNIKDKYLTPSGVNVGATKYSTPRWSTYYWDSYDNAVCWGMTWAVKRAGVELIYRGAQGKTLVAIEGISEKEFIENLIENDICSYVYEVKVPISKLEIGACPSIQEYTLSEEALIAKKTKIKLSREIFRKYFEFGTLDEVNKLRNTKVGDLIKVRTKLLNRVLDNFRDPYRIIVRRDIKAGNIKVGDDISGYKDAINYGINNDTMQLKEGAMSFSQLNRVISNGDHKVITKFVDDYHNYRKKVVKEDPTKTEAFNNEIQRAIQYITDLGNTGKVDNELCKYTIGKLDHCGLVPRPRFESAGNIANLAVVIGPTQTRAFGLTDTNSKVFIGDDHYFSRPSGLDSMNCVLKTDSIDNNISGKRVLKYNIKPNCEIDMDEVIKKYTSTTMSIPGLFKLNEASSSNFVRDICNSLGMTNCDITLVEDKTY